jgi:hypothetical protein
VQYANHSLLTKRQIVRIQAKSTLTVNCVLLCKALTACLIVLVGFMSKELMNIYSDNTFNDGSFGCIAGYATGSVTQVALTGYGYLY